MIGESSSIKKAGGKHYSGQLNTYITSISPLTFFLHLYTTSLDAEEIREICYDISQHNSIKKCWER